jgi:hypothetical protein
MRLRAVLISDTALVGALDTLRRRPACSRKLRTKRHRAWLAVVGADRLGEGRVMRREWEPEDLIACWTLVDADWRLVANKRADAVGVRVGVEVLRA